jgi:predicted permease
MSGDHDAYGVHLENPPATRPQDDREIVRYAVSPGYLQLMGIPLRAGRVLTTADRVDAPWAVVINESFVRRYFPDRDPLGQRLRIGPPDGRAYTVVGVVGDVKQLSLAGEMPDAVYTTAEQWRFEESVMSLVARGTLSASALVPVIRDAVWSVDRDQPVIRVATMEALLADSAAERRFVLLLFQLFAVAALSLTTAGIYGMMSGLVTDRTREIGLRAAVGASQWQIVGLVLKHGAQVTTVGLGVGLAVAVGGARLIHGMLFGVSYLDVTTYAIVVALLTGVAAIACAMPAWRASRIDPSSALKA